ncbi:hypothetical protein GOP47_0030126 [Adiantum capillus-veneris]|nr:hypothetical protein GOP47_0030126 [Adiantum capillus-veneris]
MQDEKNLGFFDFAFVDADKHNLLDYHERIIKLVKVGGLIGYDNTLWQGSVAVLPNATPYSRVEYYKPFILEFNKALVTDNRIEISMVPIGDGITLCRRKE